MLLLPDDAGIFILRKAMLCFVISFTYISFKFIEKQEII